MTAVSDVSSYFDINDTKNFYDPHPCFVGAIFAVPPGIKEVLEKLNGQNISVCEAMARISAVTNGMVFVNIEKRFIGLHISYDDDFDVGHVFGLIKFR